MKPRIVTHSPCGKSWRNLDRFSHCPVCCETFGNHNMADRHRVTVDGERVCRDPREMMHDGHTPVMKDGIWISGKPNPRAAKNTR